MNIPGFTGDASLYKTSGHYQITKRAINSSAKTISAVYPTWTTEVIEVFGTAPLIDTVKENDKWWEWGVPTIPDPTTPPDPPGGGGPDPQDNDDVPADIVTQCINETKNKWCGGPGGPDACKSCSMTVCQKEKCKKSGRCNPNSSMLNNAKTMYCDIGCPNTPLCKDGLQKKISVTTDGLGGVFTNRTRSVSRRIF